MPKIEYNLADIFCLIKRMGRDLKKHVTVRTKLPRKVFEYIAKDIELQAELDDGAKGNDFGVTGMKLKMREIACTLIDDYNALPMRAADATFAYFEGKSDTYHNRYSFRTTVYRHYEYSRGCKPTRRSDSLRDMSRLLAIIPGLI